MQTVFQDMRYAFRQLCKSPRFTLVAVVTLALGIGANTAIYSIIHGTLYLPYPNADRIVAVHNIYPQGSYLSISWPDFLEYRQRNTTFSQMVGRVAGSATWKAPAGPQNLQFGLVTEGYFRMYGMRPVFGRGFIPSEHQKGAPLVCALDEDFWRGELHGDPDIIGKPISFEPKPCTIVAVLPHMVPAGNHPTQIWMPMEPHPPFTEHGTNFLQATGLLKPGVAPSRALAELRGIQAQIDKQFPGNAHGIELPLLSQTIFGELRSIMNILFTAVGFVLLIACVNLANMLLARASDRAREFSIRRALGASPCRLFQQTLTESLLLALAGAFLGLVLAEMLIHVPVAAWPKGFTPPAHVHLDGAVLTFAMLLGIATGVLFGIFPAVSIVRRKDTAGMTQGRAMSESREHRKVNSILIVAEIALSMLLVAGSLNMTFYFIHLLRVDSGVNPQNVLSMNIHLSPGQYANPAQQQLFFDHLRDKLSALPGVVHVAAALDRPFNGAGASGDFTYDGQPQGTADHRPFADFHPVSPDYFATIEAPLLQGRDFTMQDGPDAQKVIIINRSMAERLWPGRSAIGKHIHCCSKDGDYTVIGVVGDVRYDGPAAPAGLEIFTTIEQNPGPALSVMLRTAGEPLAMAETARRVVASLDPGQAISQVTSLEALSQESVAGQRTSTMVTGVLGVLALLLAGVGVYGVMAYAVSRREREFGIRIALGAARESIYRLLFAKVFTLVGAGVVSGSMLVFFTRTWIEATIGTPGLDAGATVLSALALCAIAFIAAGMPARQAANVQPMQALRSE